MSVLSHILSGKAALVTGASRGIGRAVAQRLAAAGATVVVTSRSLDRPVNLPGTLKETVELIESAGGRAIALPADLENSRESSEIVDRAAQVAGGLHILVNGAGLAQVGLVETMSLETFDLVVAHYLRAPFVLSKTAIPLMRACGGGWIVNIGSLAERMPPRPFPEASRNVGSTVLGAAKLALHRLTVGLAAELEHDNIAVNMAIPSGAVSTPGADRLYPKEAPREPIEYMAETVLALCNLPASKRTGEVVYSAKFLLDNNITTYSLDGHRELPPPELPPWI